MAWDCCDLHRRRFLRLSLSAAAIPVLGQSVFAAEVPGKPVVSPQPAKPVPGAATVAKSAPPVLDDWLKQHPQVANAMTWAADKPVAYPLWPAEMKRDLQAAFALAWAGKPSGLPQVPVNLAPRGPAAQWMHGMQVLISETDARNLYLHTVAFSLAVEIGRRVAWSLVDYTPEQLGELFDARAIVWRRAGSPALYELVDTREKGFGFGVPAPPDLAWTFLSGQHLLRQDRRGTIVALLDWAGRLSHFTGKLTSEEGQNHWGYYGAPPATTIITGALYSPTGPDAKFYVKHPGPHHFTAGCHGTVSFLRSVLRVANIPCQRVAIFDYSDSAKRLSEHATIRFVTEQLYLSHGDDPYGAFVRLKPSFPVEELLLDSVRFQAWFGKPPKSEREINVGRQSSEAAINHPPIALINDRALDIEAGAGKSAGKVFDHFKTYYALEALDARGLWTRLDDAVTRLGGPDAVKVAYATAEAEYVRRQTEPVQL